MAKLTSPGKCRWCGAVLPKAGAGRHLAACANSRLKTAPPSGKKTAPRRWMHVAFAAADDPRYWLHLAVPAHDPLWAVDTVLRKVWLECCGHMSGFKIGGNHFAESPWGGGDAIGEDEDMNREVAEVLRAGDRFAYEYDFGSTTRLAGRVLADLPDVFSQDGVQVLARNDPPEHFCSVCSQAATHLCVVCACRGPAEFCDTCVQEHPCDEGTLLPVVNSPRMGVCAYCGPSQEP